jgi:FtsH-binding integral membrane protein
MGSAYPASYALAAVGSLDSKTRMRFVARTYGHLFAAVTAFTVIEIFLFTNGLAERIARALLSVSWLMVLGGFMLVGTMASWTAARARSLPAQYAALGAYVLAEAIIFVPLLFFAERLAPGTISSAATVTLVGFAGLTAIAVFSGRDFSFLRGILVWVGIGALLLIVASLTFDFTLGVLFSVAMVAFAGASILYSTSKILHTYPPDRYVSAALELFASVALMFWYLLRIFSSRD